MYADTSVEHLALRSYVALLRQYLCFCTSKASKASKTEHLLRALRPRVPRAEEAYPQLHFQSGPFDGSVPALEQNVACGEHSNRFCSIVAEGVHRVEPQVFMR